MCSPSMSYRPTVATRGGGRGREPSPARSCRGALPPTKRAQREWPRCTDAKGPSVGPARATRRLGRTRRAALIQRGPEGGVWDSPGRDGSTTRRHRSGRVIDAADGPQPPLVASLLPLTVPAPRVKRARPALPMQCARTTLGPTWASRRVDRGRGDAQGEGSREAPLGWASHCGRFVSAARQGWGAVLRVSGRGGAGADRAAPGNPPAVAAPLASPATRTRSGLTPHLTSLAHAFPRRAGRIPGPADLAGLGLGWGKFRGPS
jgi:hypothetical protein